MYNLEGLNENYITVVHYLCDIRSSNIFTFIHAYQDYITWTKFCSLIYIYIYYKKLNSRDKANTWEQCYFICSEHEKVSLVMVNKTALNKRYTVVNWFWWTLGVVGSDEHNCSEHRSGKRWCYEHNCPEQKWGNRWFWGRQLFITQLRESLVVAYSWWTVSIAEKSHIIWIIFAHLIRLGTRSNCSDGCQSVWSTG